MPTAVAQGVGQVVSNNFVRPANTTAYASGQLVANSTVAASVIPLTFISSGAITGSLSLTRTRVKKSGTSLTNAQFRVHFYSADPSASSGIVNGDGAAWSTGSTGYLGAADVTLTQAFTDGCVGLGLPSIGSEITTTFTSGRTIYALIEARAAYTPISGETFTVTLETVQV